MSEPQSLSPTPVKYPGLSLLAKGLAGVNSFATAEDKAVPGKKANALLSGLASMVGLPEAQALMEKLAYGERLTTGQGQTLKPAENVVEGALALAPLAQGLARGAVKVAGKIPTQLDSSPNALVWHGSPHRFEKLDSSKINTGEGAQSYGHGLYFAENPEVAATYKKGLSYKHLVKQFREDLPDDADFDEVLQLANAGHFTPPQARVIQELAKNDWLGFDYPSQAISEAIRNPANYDATPELLDAVDNLGNMYRIDLPDEKIARMLHWDLPLAQQPENVQKGLAQSPSVQGYIEKAEATRQKLNAQYPDRLAKIPRAGEPFTASRLKGEMALMALDQEYGNPALVAQRLRELGIPGVQYFDTQSRAAKQGTKNFVVFPGEETSMSILDINGVPLRKGLAGK